MQIDNIASAIASTTLTATLAVSTQVDTHGKAAVVEHTVAGYEAYVPGGQLGPPATGPTVDLAESRLNSTVQFQA
jgi:hypothetical protein